VAYVPGTAFFADGTGHRHLRLSYCYPEPDRIREGVRRLAAVVRGELELHDTFGSASGRPSTKSPRPARVEFPSPEQP
jgi:hypothetical protein